MEDKEINITFHFVSGESIKATFSNKKFIELIESLRNGWNAVTMTGDECGLNFSLVTHYEVEK